MAAYVTVRNTLNGDITTVSEKVLNNSRLAKVLEVVECETGSKVVVESDVTENETQTEYVPTILEDYLGN